MNLANKIMSDVQQSLLGKPEVVRLAVACFLAEGHLLIDDIPGVGKTTLAVAMARSLALSFQRIQFTSDLLPSDVLGVSVYNQKSHEFDFKHGPIFHNIILADEINRASPKTQSALLECMQEKQVSLDNATHPVPSPFFVIATQNPHEHHGTYPLPESQLDRFMMRLNLGYPSAETEVEILKGKGTVGLSKKPEKNKSAETLPEMSSEIELVQKVNVDISLDRYIIEIARLTRESSFIDLGLSPRGTLALKHAAQALARTYDRNFVIPDDIKEVSVPVMTHRLRIKAGNFNGRTFKSQESLVRELVDQVPIPV
jgi:MoxR-like ATPase